MLITWLKNWLRKGRKIKIKWLKSKRNKIIITKYLICYNYIRFIWNEWHRKKLKNIKLEINIGKTWYGNIQNIRNAW